MVTESELDAVCPSRQTAHPSISLRRGRVGAYAAVVAPIQFWLVATIAAVIRPGYDPLSQSLSDLAVGPNGWLQRLNLVVFGGMELGLVMLVAAATVTNDVWKPNRLLMVAFAGCVMLAVFPSYEHQPTIIGLLHVTSFVLVMVSLIVACFVVPKRLGPSFYPAWFRYISVEIGVASILISILICGHVLWSTLVGPTIFSGWAGLLERIDLGLLTLWLELFALQLLVHYPPRPTVLGQQAGE
ncbi:MAG TPA: DUF998 domain-containing protein [Chloroflexota bacterium]|jgi:hypothetical membrane protein|nr:DUF998 domain-containing protein [Chloroflexota bacterium]